MHTFCKFIRYDPFVIFTSCSCGFGGDYMKKKLIIGVMSALLLAGIAGCSSNNQSSAKKSSNGNSMNMSAKEMKNMKSNDKK